MWKKSLALLVAVLLTAQVCVFANYSETFEGFLSGSALNGTDSWTATDDMVIKADPVAGEGLVAYTTTDDPYAKSNATKVFEPATGSKVDVAFRLMLHGEGNGGKAKGNLVTVKDGEKPIASFAAIILRGSKDNPNPFADGSEPSHPYNASAFTMAATTDFPTDNLGNMDAKYFYRLKDDVKLTDTGKDNGALISVWFNFRFVLDFDAKTVDAYVSKEGPVTDEMIAGGTGLYGKVEGIPFLDSSAAKVDTFEFQKINATPAPSALDDVAITGDGETPPVTPDVTVENAGVSAQSNGETATIRFTSQVTGDGATAAGACVLPLWIFNESEGMESALAETVTIEEEIVDGKVFGVDVTGIPAEQFGTVVVAMPFVVADGEQIWASKASQASVNQAISQ